jgi:hypothetical protein
MPKYPHYPSQPFTGNLPSMVEMGPADLRPSSGTAPKHLRRLTIGRHLAGFGADDATPEPDLPQLPPATVVSNDTDELQRLECDDDVVGSGIFDDKRRRAINYEDAGIFANSFSMPGYVDRSKSFMKSEVRDITTGAPTVYVPGGAVSIDDVAKVAFVEGNSFIPLRRYGPRQSAMPSVSTVNVAVSPASVSAAIPPMVSSGAIVPSQSSVPSVAVQAASAAATDRAIVRPSVVAPVRPGVVVTPPTDNSRWWLVGLAAALGFGVGMVLKKKGNP